MKKIILMCLVALVAVGSVNAQSPKKAAKAFTTTEFITDIDCAGCAKKITNTIPYEKGVKDVQVDVDTKIVTVTYDDTKTNVETLIKAFDKIKIAAGVKGECNGECCHDHKAADKKACDDGCCGEEHNHNHNHNHGHSHSHDHGHSHSHTHAH